MKTKLYLAVVFSFALAGASCDDNDGDDGAGGLGGTMATGGSGGGGANSTGGSGGSSVGTGGSGGAPDAGVDAAPTFAETVLGWAKNSTNETATPASLEGLTYNMSDDVSPLLGLLK